MYTEIGGDQVWNRQSDIANWYHLAVERDDWYTPKFLVPGEQFPRSHEHPWIDMPSYRVEVARYELVEACSFRRRSELAAWAGNSIVGDSDGQFIVSFPNLSDYSGIARRYSFGFFDWADMPPSGFWVAYYCELNQERRTLVSKPWECDFLLSWIPAELWGVAQLGAARSPVMAIRWASELPSSQFPMLNKLRLAGPNI